MLKYSKVFFVFIYIILFYNAQGLSQADNLRLVYIDDYLQGDQLELSFNKSIKNSPFSFELGAALTPDFKSYNIKSGLNYYFDINEFVDFSMGLRAVYAYFIDEFSSDRQMATYFDIPIRADFKISESFFLTLTFIPTYNTFTLLNENIKIQGSVGFGYNF